jgi:NIMA (never in mitosis gene a)-related kinase
MVQTLITIYMSIKDFQIISKLGEGAYSSVFKARRLIDQEFYAIKKVKLTSLS